MVFGFLGKGGSGKSTLATQMVRYLHAREKSVLAVDADHNMDLAYNLGFDGDGPYIGGSFLPLREQFGLTVEDPTEDIFMGALPDTRFSFTKPDAYSKHMVARLENRLYLMMSGPQNDLVLHGSHCSHSLAAPLKLYLPLLALGENEAVVVDEKASVDAVSTGIPTGFDLAVVVAEPRTHSVRAAKQIAEMLDWYNVPRVVVLNKYQGEADSGVFTSSFGHEPFARVGASSDPLAQSEQSRAACEEMFSHACRLSDASTRLDRTIAKYKRNNAFLSAAR